MTLAAASYAAVERINPESLKQAVAPHANR
jgi:hypothetical protein